MMNIERTWQVAAGDVLCDIETDKATLDFESLEDGYALYTHIRRTLNSFHPPLFGWRLRHMVSDGWTQ
jgi:hypothetical protein